ncbi:MAG: AAA family ATPase [Saprospiraceae bacterium]
MKLHSIAFENFRIFKKQYFEFKPLTVLTGPNSSGKSTLVKGLTLLQENIKKPNYLGRLTFKSGNHKLGNFKSICTKKSDKESVIFELKYEFPDLKKQANKSRNTQSIWDDVKFIIITCEYSQDKAPQEENGILTSLNVKIQEQSFEKIGKTRNRKNLKIKIEEPVEILHIEQKDDFNIKVNYNWLINEILTKPNLFGLRPNIYTIYEKDDKIKIEDFQDEFERRWHKIDKKRDYYLENKDDFGKWDDDILNKFGDITSEIVDVNDKINEFDSDSEKDLTLEDLKNDLEILKDRLPDEIYDYFEAQKANIDKGIIRSEVYRLVMDACKKTIESFKTIKDVQTLPLRGDSTIGTLLLEEYWASLIEEKLNEKENQAIIDIIEWTEGTIFIKKILEKDEEQITLKDVTYDTNTGANQLANILIQNLSSIINTFIKKIPFSSLSSNRGVQKRLYRSSKPQYHLEEALSILLSMQYDEQKNIDKIGFIQKWCKQFNILEENEVLKVESIDGDFVKGFIADKNGKELTNIADLGLGIVQLLPIIIYTANAIDKEELICIEEPGTHLHPDFQAKLVDFMLDANKKHQTQFLIETHSGVFLKALHYMVKKGQLTNKELSVYFKKNSDKKFRTININKEKGLEGEFIKYWKSFHDENTLNEYFEKDRNIKELERIGRDTPTLFVEGLTDKNILDKATQLFFPKKQGIFTIKSKESAGHLWVKDMLVSWIASRRISKVAGLFDNDEAEKSCTATNNIIENLYKDREEKIKSFRLAKFKHQNLREIHRKGVLIPFGLEEIYSNTILKYANENSFCEVDIRDDFPMDSKPIGKELRKSGKGYDDFIKDKLTDDELIYMYKVDSNKKKDLSKYILSLDEQLQKEALANFEPLIKSVMDFFEKK